jgi:hypothetical protein
MEKLADEKYWKRFFGEFNKEVKSLTKNNGFTYVIPKEEQIRCALYSFLKKDFNLIEIESDLIKNNRVISEFDLRIISSSDLFIEIKRAWSLKNWINKYSEWIYDWKKDIEKLDNLDNPEYSNSIINKNFKKCFVLVTFADNNNNLSKYKITDLNNFIEEKWGKSFRFESDSEMISENIFMNLFVWTNFLQKTEQDPPY